MLNIYGKIGVAFFIACCMLGVIGMAVRSMPILWCSAISGFIAAVLSLIEARYH